MAEYSCLRSRRILAIFTSRFDRSSGFVRLQAEKALAAASTAWTASSFVPSGKCPMTCDFLQGLTDSKDFAAPTSRPPTWFFPWMGRRFSTRASASAKALRLASTVKSVSGSLRNSGSKWTLRRANLSDDERPDAALRRSSLNLKGSRPEKFGSIKAFFYRRWGERSLEPLYRRVAAEIPIASGKLLDVGCGPGKLDRLIAESRPQIS